MTVVAKFTHGMRRRIFNLPVLHPMPEVRLDRSRQVALQIDAGGLSRVPERPD